MRFINNRRIEGVPGEAGTNGTNGVNVADSGMPGLAGDAALNLAARFTARSWTGDAGGDYFELSRTVVASFGGAGGQGGNGREGALLSQTAGISYGEPSRAVYGPAGDGGDGGAGGRGGNATVLFDSLTFALGRSNWPDDGGDVVSISATALAGNGGNGGDGGWAGTTGADYSDTRLPFPVQVTGSVGGDIGDGGAGGAGGNASATVSNITASGVERASFVAEASGGQGGSGGDAGRLPGSVGSDVGTGTVAGAPGHGGDGGAGGSATAVIRNLTITAPSDDATADGANVMIRALAVGGDGGLGGSGFQSGYGYSFSITSERVLDTRTYGAPANGGDGGAGGNATARIATVSATFGDGSDEVDLTAIAIAGRGAAGVLGSPERFSTVVEGTYQFLPYTTQIIGTPAGLDGQAGTGGIATLQVTDTTISLGGGYDVLRLTLALDAPGGTERLTFARNTFDGGAGSDDVFIVGAAGDLPMTMNVKRGTLKVGNSPENVLRGFEVFVAGFGDTTFIDGAGNQRYFGGLGTDRFEFGRGHGNDRVEVFNGSSDLDVIALIGFGPAIDSFADVMARTQARDGGSVIATSATSSIFIGNLAPSQLTADMFIFA